MLENFLTQLAKEMELENVSFASEVPGVFAFPLDEGLTVLISEAGSGFSLKTSVAPCPHVKEEAFLTQAMLANLFGQGTFGAVLGLTIDGNTLVLSKVVEHQTDYKEFKEILEDFINAVDYWHDEALNHR